MKSEFILRGLAIAAGTLLAQFATAQVKDTSYAAVANKRALNIVEQLKLKSPSKQNRVTTLVAAQYVGLNNLQNLRDKELKAAATDTVRVRVIKSKTAEATAKLHKAYITKLYAQLTREQVDAVKDGMTYNTVPLTYANYLLMLPYLTEAQQTQIKNYLIEAREFAIDGGTAKEKQQWFGKYKGKIANYLAGEGYNLKKEGDDWAKRRDTTSQDAAIKRANEVIATLNLDASNKAKNLTIYNLVALQYQKIIEFNNQRNDKLKRLKDSMTLSKTEFKKADNSTWLEMKTGLEKQRNAFTQKLSPILSAKELEHLKNAMTNNGLIVEYEHFIALLPNLKADEKKQVHAYLSEARDNAMDVLTKREINQWFAKFRGRANNYLAGKGYNLRKATEELELKTGKPQ
ncbi:DUF3826 domain-containing protein [Mucilaginibacter aquatilis]|uniref:DUF3826 domain-containing protein n=1 Tax=Mucilaginibacter aquatilis TaxID=1517760 RepID=A0A6I4I8J9_9SPHI|nr:DUF3826 domain-containing protein [Mucilaginibacter aquatilis]MVN91575.1 DUF3826 domain-containing protein [Mucilaginibacter aquatilis]